MTTEDKTTPHNGYKIFLLVLLTLIFNNRATLLAQCNSNQVPACGELIMNNSFEYTSFPFVPNDYAHCFSELIFSCHWNDGSIDYSQGGTPDIFHINFSPSTAPFCATNPCGIPNSFAGTQNAIVGSPFGSPQTSFAGIHTLHRRTSPITQFREYIVQHLATPIQPGQSVNVSMQVSLAEISSRHSTISVAFLNGTSSPGIISQTAYSMDIASAYKLTFSPTSDKSIWQPLSGSWINTTGYTITDVIIGNFETDAAVLAYSPTPFSHSSWASLPGEAGNPTTEAAYYFIDDVSIQIANPCCNSANASFINIDNGPADPDGDNIFMSSIYSTISPVGITDIYIQGELIIDGSSYNLTNKEITFGPGSKVTIQNGQTWTVNGSHLHGCNEMWEGIYLDQSPCSLVVATSTIEDALTAVYLKNNSYLFSNNNQFINNLIGVHYENHTITSGNLVRKTTFKSTLANSLPAGGSNPGYLLPPHAGKRGDHGIKVTNSTVAITPIVVADKNYFEYIKNGIYATNSNLSVSNAKFFQIKNYESLLPVTDHGIAIYSSNTLTPVKYLSVGDVSLPLEVNNCDNGILAKNRLQTSILFNLIQLITYRAVSHINIVDFGLSNQIQITNNTIKNAYEGIMSYWCNHTKTNISDNTIVNLIEKPGSRGIVIEQGSIGAGSLCSTLPIQIFNNIITRHVTGISTSNATCMNIYDNDINLVSPSNAQHHGIWMNNSPYNLVTHNNIIGNFKDWQCIGIRIWKSPGVQVGCNFVDNNGIAFFLDNDCSGSKFGSNQLNRYLRGFLFVGGAMTGPQTLVSGQPRNLKNIFDKSSNSLYEFVANPSIAGANSIFYFMPWPGGTSIDIDNINGAWVDYSLNVTSTSTTNSSFPFGGFATAFNTRLDLRANAIGTTNLGYNNCGNVNLDGGEDGMQSMIENDFNSGYYNEVEFVEDYEYKEEHEWMYQHNTYRSYNIMQSGLMPVAMSTEVSTMMDEITSSEVANLDAVDAYIGNKDWAAARALNQSITTNTNYGAMLQNTNALLIDQWEQITTQEQYQITDENIIGQILGIANLCLTEYGDAVLKARIFAHNHIDPTIEFIDLCENPMDDRSISTANSGEQNTAYSLVYPNPATKTVNISFNGDGVATYTVTDILGKNMMQGILTNVQNIDVGNWETGIYLIQITGNGYEKTHKLVVNN